MKELTRKEIQTISLEILKDIHRFCKENDIHYSIAYGTLIGAIRHKGFIPWDEDIDIMMKREDYEKFSKTYKSDRYEFISYDTTHDCWLLFGRVCDNLTTTERTTTPWLDHNQDVGIWIDVFPIDEVPDNLSDFKQTYGLLNHLYLQSIKARRVHSTAMPGMPLKFKLKSVFRHRTHPRMLKKNPREFLEYMKMVIDSNQGIGYQHYAQCGCADDVKGFLSKKDVAEYIELPFEDTTVMAFKEYDSILTKIFGNYMQEPPQKIKNMTQRKFLRFYWKNK